MDVHLVFLIVLQSIKLVPDVSIYEKLPIPAIADLDNTLPTRSLE